MARISACSEKAIPFTGNLVVASLQDGHGRLLKTILPQCSGIPDFDFDSSISSGRDGDHAAVGRKGDFAARKESCPDDRSTDAVPLSYAGSQMITSVRAAGDQHPAVGREGQRAFGSRQLPDPGKGRAIVNRDAIQPADK